MRESGEKSERGRPLPARIRPASIGEILGQEHLTGPEGALARMIGSGRLSSMILWGPPGVGKTSIARLAAQATGAEHRQLSAVSSGIADVRKVIAEGRKLAEHGSGLVLFLDEIHRFNKSQQDALLPAVEEGWITLIGATTENPSFEVIPPLLSRLTLFLLNPLGEEDLLRLARRAAEVEPAIGEIPEEALRRGARMSGGDGRKYLTGLELALRIGGEEEEWDRRLAEAFRSQGMYDRQGEAHYDIVSAFIKALRGSDPDAALFWAARMLDGGEDPLFIARRMIIFASEDVGNADPYAITLAVNVYQAIERIGMPEGRIVLGQGITYLATALKSNASYRAINDALADAARNRNAMPPLHLRNAPTGTMKRLGYGKGYRYAHDHPDGFVAQEYFPAEMTERTYYHPTERGREKSILERLLLWWPGRGRKKRQ